MVLSSLIPKVFSDDERHQALKTLLVPPTDTIVEILAEVYRRAKDAHHDQTGIG
jgi:hypothetical protein